MLAISWPDSWDVAWALADWLPRSGFLGSRASMTLDVVFVTLLAAVPLMAISWYLARRAHQYRWHKRLQLALAAGLVVSIVLFEVDIRLHGWRHLAEPSPYWRAGRANDVIDIVLLVHLACAIPTVVAWIAVVVQALRHFPNPPSPAAHSRWHRRWGQAAMIGLVLTAVTGWTFYWLAFVA